MYTLRIYDYHTTYEIVNKVRCQADQQGFGGHLRYFDGK